MAGNVEASEPGLEERRVAALERLALNMGLIAEVLVQMAKTQNLQAQVELKRYDREYPEKREARDAVVTHPQTDEEKLREAQGDTGESDEEWVGRRESAFNQAQARRAAKTARS